ncbi:MAG: helix-turn-helix transcriptional regulator [Coriobacteriaceae bacterium]|jgi:DNA-binding CsgD family transcriptional regulator|nr:helix-turn-helix transcriptional regulator [Coriobacteriaceae bacterium]
MKRFLRDIAPKLKLNLVCGLGFLTAQTLCSISGQIEAFSDIHYFSSYGFLSCLIVSVMMMAGVALWQISAVRRILSVANLLMTSVWIVDALYCVGIVVTGGTPSGLALLLFACCCRISSMILTIQWSLFIAACDEQGVILNVSLAMTLAVILYILVCQIGGIMALAVVGIMLLGSNASLIREEFSFDDPSAESLDCTFGHRVNPEEGKEKAWFYSLGAVRARLFASRIAWGVLFGLLFAAASLFPQPKPGSTFVAWCSLLLLTALGVVVFFLFKKEEPPLSAATFLPALLAGIVYVCFFESDTNSHARVFVVICHLSWFTQMFYQTPTYRRLLRMDPAVFAYSDKLCSFISFECTMWAMLALAPSVTFLGSPQTVAQAAQWYTIALLAISIVSMSNHFLGYYPQSHRIPAFKNALPVLAREDLPNIVDRLSEQYRLTAREADVFRLLALGYSKPYIQKSLFLSEGTVRTHVRNIYQKLAVTSRDELIVLVNRQMD